MTTTSTVLIVEDDPTIRQLLGDALVDEGYAVVDAANGQEALEALAQLHPDAPAAIILDLMMPVMDGWNFRAKQLNRGLAPNTPVIVLSASRRAATSTDELNARVVLPKPFDLGELLDVVASATGRTDQEANDSSPTVL